LQAVPSFQSDQKQNLNSRKSYNHLNLLSLSQNSLGNGERKKSLMIRKTVNNSGLTSLKIPKLPQDSLSVN